MKKNLIWSVRVVVFFCFVVIVSIVYGLWHTYKAYTLLAQYQTASARQHLEKSQRVTSTVSRVTRHHIADIELWHQSLLAAQSGLEVIEYFQAHTTAFLTSKEHISLLPLQHPLSALSSRVQAIEQLWPKTVLAPHFFSKSIPNIIPIIKELTSHAENLITNLAQKKTHWLFLLQNSDEIRATGGFMGSYVIISFENGVVGDLIVEDIYDADGQFTGYVQAPPGVEEYLSSQKGLRLPDANWSPDFPTSAEAVLQFFALGKKRDISFVTALTSNFVSDIVAITGPLILPDYDLIITSTNFSQTLRSTRDDFFPGNLQKKHIISQLIAQIKSAFSQLSSENQYKLFELLQRGFQDKSVQFFSLDPQIQKTWSRYEITGDLYPKKFALKTQTCNCSPFFFGSIESNVGINKINPFIKRSTALSIHNNQPEATVVLQNTMEPFLTQEKTALSQIVSNQERKQKETSKTYVNYHRFYIDPSTTLEQLVIDGKVISEWDEKNFFTKGGKELKEIGFLVVVPPQNSVIVTAHFNTHKPSLPTFVFLPKQASLSNLFTVSFRDTSLDFTLDTDMVVNLLELEAPKK